MKVSMCLPLNHPEFQSLTAIRLMVTALERHGYDACYVNDHPIPSEEWLNHGGNHAFDPFVALAVAAASTRSLRLHTHAVVLAYRNAFLAAKSAACLDALSGGRLILGVGAGYLREEFTALGANYADRGKIMDESIAVMRAAWSGEMVEFHGEFFHAPGNRALPVPQQQPGPPIWIGGNSNSAMRRAAELGDGWSPFPTQSSSHGSTAEICTISGLREKIVVLQALRAKIGRNNPFDICMMPFLRYGYTQVRPDRQWLIDQLGEFRASGVTWTALSLPCTTKLQYLENLEWFRTDVMKSLL